MRKDLDVTDAWDLLRDRYSDKQLLDRLVATLGASRVLDCYIRRERRHRATDRHAFEFLCDVEELSVLYGDVEAAYRELAKLQGVPVGTVAGRHAKALERFDGDVSTTLAGRWARDPDQFWTKRRAYWEQQLRDTTTE
jgi:hypothetical protein